MSMRRPAHVVRLSAVLTALLVAVACGKKGPPLAPLRLVPAPVTDVSAHVIGQDVQLRFGLPNKNLNGPGRIDIDRVEIYAITMPPGSGPPTNRDLLTKGHVVGAISVKPPPVEGEPTEPEKPDPRPGPGDRVTFVERLTDEKIKPEVLPAAPDARKKGGRGPATAVPGAPTEGEPTPPGVTGVPAAPPVPPAGQPASTPTGQPAPAGTAQPVTTGTAPAAPAAPGAPAGTPAAQATPPAPSLLRRVYAMRGISHGGRPGQPARIDVPIVPPPPPVEDVRASFTEHAITVDWRPPLAEPGGLTMAFNVYPATPDAAPLNAGPQSAVSFEHTSMEFGKEQCYVVRTVEIVQNVTFESESSAPPACTTPRDVFPPPPPNELRGIASEGAIDLTWEANTEADLAGYLVLRGEGADDTLRPLTKEPIHETTFHDATVSAGIRYVYAVIAIDNAGNRSKESGRFTETAR